MLLTNNYRIHLPTVRDDEPLAKSTGALDLQTKRCSSYQAAINQQFLLR